MTRKLGVAIFRWNTKRLKGNGYPLLWRRINSLSTWMALHA